MEEYIRYMNRKNRRNAVKLLVVCAVLFLLFSFIAYANTRYNGFADVKPAAFYFEKIHEIWQYFCEVVSHKGYGLN